MSRLILTVAALALAAPTVSAAPVPPEGGKGTVFPYPARAPIVVCLNGYDRARERLNTMLKAALPDDAAKLTRLLDDQLSKLLEGRKLTGVRKDARAFLVLNDLAGLFDGSYPLSVLVPVTSTKAFQEAFLTKDELKSLDRGKDGVDSIKTVVTGEEQTVFLVDLKEYVAITIDRGTADGYAAKYVAGSTDTMGPELSASFLNADLAAYVNMDSINEQYGDQIRGFRGLIDFGLQQAQQQGMLPGLGKKQLDAIKVVMKGLFQGLEDCRAVVFAAEFRPEGLAVRLQARFAENTPSAKLIKAEASGKLGEVGRLPTGFGTYTESRVGDTFGDLLHVLSQEFATTEEDEKGAALIEQHLKDRAASGPGGEWSATSAPGITIVVTSYKDPAKAARAVTKAYKAIAPGGRVNSMVVKTTPRVSDEAEKHRGFTFTEVRLNFDFEATVAALPDAIKETTLETFKRTVNEKTIVWVGTDGKVVVQLTAKDWDLAKATLDKYLDGKQVAATDPGFKLTRSQLPPDASLLMIGETGTVLTSLTDSMRGVGEMIPGFPKISPLKTVKGDPTYVGFAITLKGDTVGVAAFVPTGAITVARKLLDAFFKNVE